jgi:predicted transglutaminase-like cysteine proteinase
LSKTAVALILLFLIASLVLVWYLGYFDTLSNILNPNSEPDDNEPRLYMQLSSHLNNWNELSGHPTADYMVTIIVRNVGLVQSTSAMIDFEIRSNERIVENGAIDVGIVNEDETKNFSRTFRFEKGTYEASYVLRISSKIWDTYSDSFGVGIPRYGLGDHVRFYVTPIDPYVQTQLTTTGKDLNMIYNWVGDNIQYESDIDIHGKEEYWQFPYETLELKSGDCEDQAFLLCSLIRASGEPAEDTFVALGIINSKGHAWVIVRTPLGWRTLEPTVDGIVDRVITNIYDFLNVEGRLYFFAANDVYFEEINPNTNHSFVNQEFLGWYEDNLKLDGDRVTIEVNHEVTLKINMTNTGDYDFLGFIQVKIQKDMVLTSDSTFTTQTFHLSLSVHSSRQLELRVTPNEITEDAPLKCRQYYYQVYTCFSSIYNPDDEENRECLFVYS